MLNYYKIQFYIIKMIQSIERALDILEFLANKPEKPVFLSQIAQKTGLNLGTCANILKTLVSRNYAEQLKPRQGYSLGPMIFFLGKNGPYRKDLVKTAESLMVKLAQEIKETVLLVILREGKRFILSQIKGDQIFQPSASFLFQEGVYQTATGRLLLAYLSPEELQIFIRKYGLPSAEKWPEATTEKTLETALVKIRKGKRVITRQGDVIGIAFPVLEKERAVAALGLFLLSFRFNGANKTKILEKMEEIAVNISKRLQ